MVDRKRRLIGWRVKAEMFWSVAWAPMQYGLFSLPGARKEARELRAAGGYRNVRIVRVYRVRKGDG